MENLVFALNIVLPMAILLALGYLFKRNGMFSQAFIAGGKKFCFHVLLSWSLFKNLYDSSLSDLPYRLIIFVLAAIMAEFVCAVFIAKALSSTRKQTGVIIQGLFRSNFAFIGIPLATMMYTDEETIAFVSKNISLLSIFVIPLFNVLAVVSLAYFNEHGNSEDLLGKTLGNIARNPCIRGICAGLLVLLFRAIVPQSAFFVRDQLPFVYKTLSYLASMSSPLAFLLVGASLDFSHSIANIRKLSLIVLLKILVFPGAVMLGAYALGGFVSADFACLVSVFASPTAVASAIMANEMGGDEDLANEIVVYTTLFSILSLVLIIYFLKMAGCL